MGANIPEDIVFFISTFCFQKYLLTTYKEQFLLFFVCYHIDFLINCWLILLILQNNTICRDYLVSKVRNMFSFTLMRFCFKSFTKNLFISWNLYYQQKKKNTQKLNRNKNKNFDIITCINNDTITYRYFMKGKGRQKPSTCIYIQDLPNLLPFHIVEDLR